MNTPEKVQDFLNTLEFNFEEDGIETLRSPIMVLRTKNAHCLEGAIFGAYALSLYGFPPLIIHQEATKDDQDHTIAPFKINGLWGALSKTNHYVLRYREPIYRSIRELMMSYFHEYFLNSSGLKTLRRYSRPLNLNIFKKKKWYINPNNLWYIDKKLDEIKHYDIAPKEIFKKLRKVDKIEIEAGKIVEYKKEK